MLICSRRVKRTGKACRNRATLLSRFNEPLCRLHDEWESRPINEPRRVGDAGDAPGGDVGVGVCDGVSVGLVAAGVAA
jgi:hypothetical protein